MAVFQSQRKISKRKNREYSKQISSFTLKIKRGAGCSSFYNILPFNESLSDSYKDTLNNIEAVYAATKNNLQGHDIDGRLWLNDFDYLHNRWRRKKRRRW